MATASPARSLRLRPRASVRLHGTPTQKKRASESMLDAMERELESRTVTAMNGEIDQFAESYVPSAPLEPEFQEFLGKLVKKIGRGIKSVAKKAISVAGQF